MNRFFFMIILMILNVNSSLHSNNLISYRGLALGNIIADDLDLIYDPIDLQFVEGVRVYTNLSNATSGEEKLFGNVSDDEFLFGISAEGPFLNFMHHSLLIKFQKSEISNPVEIDSDLDGYNDFYGSGNITNEYNAFYDSDEDGLFDLKQMISQNKSNLTNNNNYSFILNNSFELWFFSMGLKLSVGDFKNSRNTSSVALGSINSVLLGVSEDDPTFEKSLSNFLLDINEDNFTLTENGDFKSLDKFNFSRFDVSAMFEIGNFEIRGDANLSSNQNIFEIKDIYSGEYEYFENESINYEDYYSESDSYLSLTEESGSTIGYGGSLRYIFNYQDERKNDGYWKIGFSMGLGSYDYDALIFSSYLNNEFRFDGSFYEDENIDVETNDKTDITDSGTKNETSYAFNSSLNIPINDNIHFGIGAIVSHNKTSRMTLYNEEINNLLIKAFTDTTIDNYTITENYALVADRNHDVSETRYIVPTGLEYRLGQQNQFSLRVGSIFQLSSIEIKDSKEINEDESEPFTWIKEYSDGTQELYMVDDIYESTKEVNKTTISSTIFTYGFGFNPMNNFQIDLLGVFNSDASVLDTEFYKNLQISFTLKFD